MDTSIYLLRTMITSLRLSHKSYILSFSVILGLDPRIHLPIKVSMDAASSAA